MSIYRVNYTVSAEAEMLVEASNAQEAKQAVLQSDYMSCVDPDHFTMKLKSAKREPDVLTVDQFVQAGYKLM